MKILQLSMISLFLFISGCSTIGGVWEAGKTVVTGTVDSVVTGTSMIVSAVTEDVVDAAAFVGDTTAGIVEDAADYIDAETDAIQDPEETESPQ
jgi:mannose/fructose/N-acetylgalactosamine-specific phosphotransferase system component IIC